MTLLNMRGRGWWGWVSATKQIREIGAKIVPGYPAAGGALDFQDVFNGDDANSSGPVPHRRFGQADRFGDMQPDDASFMMWVTVYVCE